MQGDSANQRTHEPSLRELTAQLDDLKDLLIEKDKAVRELMQERDRRYEDRFKAQETAVGAALSAQKESTSQAFMASEKAIVKAEDAQKSYNQTHNDLSRKMDDQYKLMTPRTEYEKSIDNQTVKINDLKDSINKEIQGLRESRSEVSGKGLGLNAAWGYLIGAVGIIAIIVALLHKSGV